jgi:hypothetical protein
MALDRLRSLYCKQVSGQRAYGVGPRTTGDGSWPFDIDSIEAGNQHKHSGGRGGLRAAVAYSPLRPLPPTAEGRHDTGRASALCRILAALVPDVTARGAS